MALPKNQVVTFKVTSDELEGIKRGATKEGMTLSEYCRACVLRDRFTDNDVGIIEGFIDTVFSSLDNYVKLGSTLEEKQNLRVDLFKKKMEEKAARDPEYLRRIKEATNSSRSSRQAQVANISAAEKFPAAVKTRRKNPKEIKG